MKTKELLKMIAQAARHKDVINDVCATVKKRESEYSKLCAKIAEDAFFEDMEWSIRRTHHKCEIRGGVLFSSGGELLSTDGRCMNEQIPYFVNQTTGYLGDDYYGVMFVKVDDKNTFVEIEYAC